STEPVQAWTRQQHLLPGLRVQEPPQRRGELPDGRRIGPVHQGIDQLSVVQCPQLGRAGRSCVERFVLTRGSNPSRQTRRLRSLPGSCCVATSGWAAIAYFVRRWERCWTVASDLLGGRALRLCWFSD